MNKSHITDTASTGEAGKVSAGSATNNHNNQKRSRARNREPLAVGGGAQDVRLDALVDSARDLGDRMETLVRERPLVAMAGATALGALLGGVVFSKAGRLVFLALAGAVATEVWKSEGKIDVRGLLDKLTSDDEGDAHDERASNADAAAKTI